MDETISTWRTLVGIAVEHRREQLNLSKRAAAARAGISEIVWRQIESGLRQIAPQQYAEASPGRRSRLGVCRALGWSDDSIERLLAGQPPGLLDVSPPDDLVALQERVERLAAQVERLARASTAMSVAIDSLSAQAARATGR